MSLSVEQITVVEKLVFNKGYIKTNGRSNRPRFRKAFIYLDGDKRWGTISIKLLWSLYQQGLMARRIICEFGYDQMDYYTIWQVYKPELKEHECFKELAIQFAVGSL